MRRHRYYVYLLTSSSRRALYTGVTSDLEFRKILHLEAGENTFVGKYKAYRLVYYEEFQWIQAAIAREKEIKGWTRKRKEALVLSVNPGWKDLSAEWGKPFALITPESGPEASRKKQDQPQGPSHPTKLRLAGTPVSRQEKGAQDDKGEG